jgi:DNA-binding response OmpR family regulator
MTRILVVEDSRTQLEEIRQILEDAGFTVDAAADGSQGLERLLQGPYDLVLSDVLMPGLSGYDLCRAAKTHPQTKHVPVVLITQLTDPLDILRGLECGADNFITKPFDAHFLVRRVQSILANRRRRPGQPAEPGVSLSFRGRGVTITTDKEQILDLLFATLEEFVRTKALEAQMKTANRALTKQTQDLAEAGRRKDRHLAMLAHELRTPLAPLLNGLHVLRDAPGDSPARGRALDAMDRQVHHLRTAAAYWSNAVCN